MSTFEEEQEQVVYENKILSEIEVTQMLRDAIDQNPEGAVWHVNTKHLVTFAQMVADKTKRELESSPEEFSSWVKFYEDRIEHLDKMLVKFMDMNRVLMGKLSKEKQESKENQEAWEAHLYEQGESKEDQRKADEAAWSDARIACAAIRDAELDAARDDAALVTAAYSNYVASCVAIDDAARVGARAYCTEEEEPRAQHMSTPFDRHWLETGACVPVDIETMAALVSEIHRLMAIIEVVTAKLKEKNA